MSTTYVVGVRIDGNSASYLRAVQQAQSGTRAFVNGAKAEFDRLKGFMQSYQGQLASLGLGVGFAAMATGAAKLQRNLTQVSLAAGMTATQQAEAYKTMFDLVNKNGGVMEDAVGGFAELTQAGLKYEAAMAATKAVSLASAVTGVNNNALSTALTMGAANFKFDLAEPGRAALMLDQMAVAGNSGRAELEDLSNIFSKVAQRAQSANMSFGTTLAFIEGLSLVSSKDTLGTLADSTLRLFTNANYAKDAEKATGVKFFDKKGARRDDITILEEMREGFVKLKTDAEKFNYISKAFGKADLDTQRGLLALLDGDILKKIREFEAAQKTAKGKLEGDAPRAMQNAATQAERLRNTLRQAAEQFATPINDAVANAIKHLLNNKDKGGMGLTGGQLAAGGVAGAVGVYALSRILPGIAGKLLGRTGGLAAGVAEGKALQAAAGVQPVYVTNWAEMGGGSGAGDMLGAAAGGAAGVGMLSKLRSLTAAAALVGTAPIGLAGAGAIAGGVGLAAGAGAAVGTGIYKYGLEGTKAGDGLGELLARFMSVISDDAKNAVAINDALKNTKVGGELTVRVMGNPNVAVQAEAKPFNGTRINTSLGQTNLAAGH